jgi:tetratricopeptide (TPR) repeat protein
MLDQGRNAEARALVEEARKLDPNSREIEPLRGLVAMQMRDYTLAEAIFSRLSKADPSQPAYAALFTLALVEQDDPSRQTQGLNLAEANARRFPKALDILAALGRAHARVGHRDEAERCLRAAIAAAGGQATPTTAYFLAEVLVQKGATEDARILLTGATASPIAFAYLADARKQLASLQTAPGAGSSNSDVGISKP